MTSNSNASQQPSTRLIAATTLALLLRYTTYIEPPLAKSRDDHILSVLIRVLSSPEERANLRSEPKLRHRLLAALGESVFYISAQLEEAAEGVEGEVAKSPGQSKWFVPPAAIGVIGTYTLLCVVFADLYLLLCYCLTFFDSCWFEG